MILVIPQPMPSAGGYPPYPTGNVGMPSFGGFPPYPPTNQYQYPQYPSQYPNYPQVSNYIPPTPFNNSIQTGGTGTIKDEHIRESLLSAIQDKLMRRMKEQFQQSQAELDTLKRTEDELKQGKAKLDSIIMKLEKEKNDLDKNITMLKDKEQELNKAIERISNQESIDVDDAVTTTAPLYKQYVSVNQIIEST